MTVQQASDCLQAAIMLEVESRNRIFDMTKALTDRISQMAMWLTNGDGKFGMMLCGTCGNGKTTFLKALRTLLNRLQVLNDYDNSTYGLRIATSKEIVQLYKTNYENWRKLCRYSMLAIDDLGCEPTELVDYGNVSNPIIDLLSIRYDEQLLTLISTNMTPVEIRNKYGDRIADRLNEMMERITFDTPSYRTDSYQVKKSNTL